MTLSTLLCLSTLRVALQVINHTQICLSTLRVIIQIITITVITAYNNKITKVSQKHKLFTILNTHNNHIQKLNHNATVLHRQWNQTIQIKTKCQITLKNCR